MPATNPPTRTRNENNTQYPDARFYLQFWITTPLKIRPQSTSILTTTKQTTTPAISYTSPPPLYTHTYTTHPHTQTYTHTNEVIYNALRQLSLLAGLTYNFTLIYHRHVLHARRRVPGVAAAPCITTLRLFPAAHNSRGAAFNYCHSVVSELETVCSYSLNWLRGYFMTRN